MPLIRRTATVLSSERSRPAWILTRLEDVERGQASRRLLRPLATQWAQISGGSILMEMMSNPALLRATEIDATHSSLRKRGLLKSSQQNSPIAPDVGDRTGGIINPQA